MTFVPTPRAELPSIAELFESTAESQQALLSYLFYQQEVASGFLAVVADLYRRLGGKTAGGFWTWADDALTPGTMRVLITGTTARRILLSRTDADANPVDLQGFGPGKSVVLMDDPGTPPVTAFRQYLVTSSLTDHGTWWQFDATRTATFGRQDTPTNGTRINLLFS